MQDVPAKPVKHGMNRVVPLFRSDEFLGRNFHSMSKNPHVTVSGGLPDKTNDSRDCPDQLAAEDSRQPVLDWVPWSHGYGCPRVVGCEASLSLVSNLVEGAGHWVLGPASNHESQIIGVI